MIAAEAEHASAGRPAAIWAKMNSLIDSEVIDALYAASQAGVQISLVVRGICGLRPNCGAKRKHPGQIGGRSLSRAFAHRLLWQWQRSAAQKGPGFYLFGGLDGAQSDAACRNIDRDRNATVKAQIMSQIMAANLADVAQSWIMAPDGSFRRPTRDEGQFAFSCHRFFMENPSLSGRGSAGASDVPLLTHTDD